MRKFQSTMEKVTMENTNILESILKNHNCTAVETNLSFINRLFPNLGNNAQVILLCKISPNVEFKDDYYIKEEATSALEVTGSPLSHSFGDDSFNVTLSLAKRNWFKREEKFQPIPKQIALTILNTLNEKVGFNSNWALPVFALCDVTNSRKHVVLLGSHFDSSWFITHQVTTSAMKSLTNIQNGCNELLSEHMFEIPRSKGDKDVKITSTYELCGTSSEMIDWQEQSKSEFKGYLKIDATWNSLSFLPSQKELLTNLTAEIMSGSHSSPLHDLWEQILLLNKYLTILEDYQNRNLNSRYSVMPLNFPPNFSTSFFEDEATIILKLNQLLSGYDNFDEKNDDEVPIHESDMYEVKLNDLIKELSKRGNLDFTDRLWRIIRGIKNYMQMTDCFYMVFESIKQSNYNPQLNDMKETRFAKMVTDLEGENCKVSLLAGGLSLELAIDMGMQKICRDYMYLLLNMNIIEVSDLRKSLSFVPSGEFMIEKYRNKLMNLAQIHISLEFLQLIQCQLYCRPDIAHLILESALNKYYKDNSLLKYEELMKNTIHKLSIPAPKEFITAITKTAPTSWMCTLTTKQSLEKFTTVTHYSRQSIFPPNFNKLDAPENIEEKDEIYFVTKALVTFFKRN